MVAWYIATERRLPLNQELLFKYALAHDFVEVFAGDLVSITATDHHIQRKHKQEHEAAIRLQRELPEFAPLHDIIQTYSSKADPESRFIYVIDKVLPVLNSHLDGNSWYHQNNVTLDKHRKWLLKRLESVEHTSDRDGGFIAEIMAFLDEHPEIFQDRSRP